VHWAHDIDVVFCCISITCLMCQQERFLLAVTAKLSQYFAPLHRVLARSALKKSVFSSPCAQLHFWGMSATH
jgi:hypothetical protein